LQRLFESGKILGYNRKAGEVTLFTRPRRFGKTLNMSMMEKFFSVEGNKGIFEGLEISKEKELCRRIIESIQAEMMR